MIKIQEAHIIQGMQRDISPSRQPVEFMYEGLNIRLTARENDTLFSITNEKGTEDTAIRIKGTYIGHCVLNEYLVVFSTTSPERDKDTGTTTGYDYITRIDMSSSPVTAKELLPITPSANPEDLSKSLNIGLCTENPVDAIVSYESEDIQKVYWTDGYNQLRLINISPSNDENIGSYTTSSFDAVPELQLTESVTVEKQFGTYGEFSPGPIQYAFTYYNKHGQESNIFYTTRLYNVAHRDRGASPEEKVNLAFRITVTGVDENFDYLRIYSIHRTSLNATPICKRVVDIEIEGLEDNKAAYTDTGINGDSIDPTELLYKGGELVVSQTLEQKDNTLFLGNLSLKREPVPDTVKNWVKSKFREVSIQDKTEVKEGETVIAGLDTCVNTMLGEIISQGSTGIPYVNNIDNSGLKTLEVYRFGIQFQHKHGNWSEPVWLRDYQIKRGEITIDNISYKLPYLNETNGVLYMPGVEVIIGDSDVITSLKNSGYKRARLLMAQPTNIDRHILCQGIVNPVVYSDANRKGYTVDNEGNPILNDDCKGSLMAQASWMFRPYFGGNDYDIADGLGGYIGRHDNGSLPDLSDFEGKVNGGEAYTPWKNSIEIGARLGDDYSFKLDEYMCTFHTPELVFDEALYSESWEGVKVYKRGYARFNADYGDISIQTKAPTIGTAAGFRHVPIKTDGNAALISGLFYEDFLVDDRDSGNWYEKYNKEKFPVLWPVCMWHHNGSLNNDVQRDARSAELLKKVISNYHVSDATNWKEFDNPGVDVLTPKLFSSDEPTIIKVPYIARDQQGDSVTMNGIYMGNIDTMLYPKTPEYKYFSGNPRNENADGCPSITDDLDYRLALKDPEDPDTMNCLQKRTVVGGSIYWPRTTISDFDIGDSVSDLCVTSEPIRMKYKSTPHLVLSAINDGNFEFSTDDAISSLPVVEIVRDYNKNTFYGGTTDDALKANVWIPISDPVTIGENIDLKSGWGDTWYQRFDCMKTYPFTNEDVNQVVDIASFLVETHFNIDGRYDKNRGQSSNLNMSPKNYNLYNPVYSQANNFFSYRIMDSDFYNRKDFPNQVTWTKEKQPGADVDIWTNITMANTCNMDGSNGGIVSLNTQGDNLYCLQDKGISVILFNSRVQIPVSDGVPIEITNGYKVDGYRHVIDGVGCSSRSLVKETSSGGLYFIDSVGGGLWLINNGLKNISDACKMSTWFKDNMGNINKLAYDDINKDLYLIQDDKALCFSEKTGQFTGFYGYGGADLVETYGGKVLTLHDMALWEMFEGDYCHIFGENVPWNVTLINNGTQNNLTVQDKVYANLEFRAAVEGDGEEEANTGRFIPILPFDVLEAWDSYQWGRTPLKYQSGHSAFVHGGMEESLKRKFRIWRCDIPRSNVKVQSSEKLPVNCYRKTYKPLDRMRNQWVYLKLGKEKAEEGKKMPRIEIHDITVGYYV